MRPKTVRILYWVTTLLFVVPQAWSAIQYLIEAPRMVETITGLGYPIYFMKILAMAKLLGIAAILYGRFTVLKEWAYAGFTFEVIAAMLSHFAHGDGVWIGAVPFAFLVMQLFSYFAWHSLPQEPAAARVRPPLRRPSGVASARA